MFNANPSPSDLSYLSGRPSGYGSWNPDEPLTDLRRSWLEYYDYSLEYYHQPDLEALRIMAAVLLSHYVLTERAIWIFLIGESSTGKTSFFIEPFSTIPTADVKSNITPKSFLSGLGKSKSLLDRTGPSGIWLFKDFTSVLSMPYDARMEVMKYLREIWDGEVSNETGGDAKKMDWSGKITSVAACTYSIDTKPSAAELGERFLRLNLRTPNPEGAYRAATLQVGRSSQISSRLQILAKKAFLNAYRQWESAATPVRHNGLKSLVIPEETIRPSSQTDKLLFSFATIVATCRVETTWDFTRKEIIYIGKTEGLPRISRSLWLLMLSHARLFGRTSPEEEDFNAARRLATNSMPEGRRIVLSSLPLNKETTRREMFKTVGRQLSRRQFREALDELVTLGVIDLRNPSAASLDDDVYVSFSSQFRLHFQNLFSDQWLTKTQVLQMPSSR